MTDRKDDQERNNMNFRAKAAKNEKYVDIA